MSKETAGSGGGGEYRPDRYYERRQYERRASSERRGAMRWDPRADEKERRCGDRRRPSGAYIRQ